MAKTGRRRLVEEAKRDRIENYESSNDPYIIEDFGLGALINNIALFKELQPEA